MSMGWNALWKKAKTHTGTMRRRTKLFFFDFPEKNWPMQVMLVLAVVAPSVVLALYSYRSAEQQFSTQAFIVYCTVLGANLMLTLGIIHQARLVKEAYRFEKAYLEDIGDCILAVDA